MCCKSVGQAYYNPPFSEQSHGDHHAISRSCPVVPEPGAAGHGGHAKVAPGEIAVGVIVGRTSEYFDFFVFGIACVLVFPRVFFPFEPALEGTLWSFVIFSFAFIARPIGTALSMAIQRRWGAPPSSPPRCSCWARPPWAWPSCRAMT